MGLASGLGLLKGFVFAAVIGSHDFGLYALALLVGQYGQFAANLGIFNVIQTRLPQAYGRGDADVEDQIRTALASLAVSTTVTMAPYFAFVAFVIPTSSDVRTVLLLAGVLTVLGSALEFYLAVLRAQRRLDSLARLYVVRSVTALLVGIVAGASFGFRGVLCAEAAALLLVAVLGTRNVPLRPRLRAGSQVLALVRIGSPLMLVSMLFTASVSLDRLFVASSLPADLGQYTFAALVVVGWLAVGSIVAQLVVPQILFDRGAGVRAADLSRRMRRYMSLVTVTGILGALMLYLVISLVGTRLFPEYESGLKIMPIMFLGGAASMLALPVMVLQALRPAWALLSSGAALVLLVAGSTLTLAYDPSVTHFALVFAGAQIFGTVVAVAALEAEFRRQDRAQPASWRPSRGR